MTHGFPSEVASSRQTIASRTQTTVQAFHRHRELQAIRSSRLLYHHGVRLLATVPFSLPDIPLMVSLVSPPMVTHLRHHTILNRATTRCLRSSHNGRAATPHLLRPPLDHRTPYRASSQRRRRMTSNHGVDSMVWARMSTRH